MTHSHAHPTDSYEYPTTTTSPFDVMTYVLDVLDGTVIDRWGDLAPVSDIWAGRCMICGELPIDCARGQLGATGEVMAHEYEGEDGN